MSRSASASVRSRRLNGSASTRPWSKPSSTFPRRRGGSACTGAPWRENCRSGELFEHRNVSRGAQLLFDALAPAIAQHIARFFLVAPHLGDEILDRGKFQFVADET